MIFIIIFLLLIFAIIYLLTDFIKFYVFENLKIVFTFKNKNNKNIFYSFNDEFTYNSLILLNKKNNIPNYIFQIWLNDDNFIPFDVYNNIENLKKNNSNWKYFLITPKIINNLFNNYNDNFSKQIKFIYDNINYNYLAVKSDIIRYFLLYKFGGVYLDIKSNTIVSLDYFQNNNKIILFNWCEPNIDFNIKKLLYPIRKNLNNSEIIQWFLIFPINHYILKIILNKIISNYYFYTNNKKISQNVFEFSGPILFSNIIYKYFNKNDYELLKCFNNYLIYNNLNSNHLYYYKKFKHYTILNEKIVN